MTKILLEELLENREITRYELSKRAGLNYQTVDAYYKNKVRRYDGYILEQMCKALDCDIGDILKIVPEVAREPHGVLPASPNGLNEKEKPRT